MTYHCTKFHPKTISQTLVMNDFLRASVIEAVFSEIHNIHNLTLNGVLALQIELELGNRCKFNMALFKNKNVVLKWCFRRDKFVSGIRCILAHSSSMGEDILMKFAGLMHHRIGYISIL